MGFEQNQEVDGKLRRNMSPKMFFFPSHGGISGKDRHCSFEILFEIGLYVPEWPGGSQCKH